MMSERANLTLISPAIRDAMEQWLSHERALKAAADNTLNAYGRDCHTRHARMDGA